MKTLQIIHDYKTLAIPLDMIARNNKATLGHTLNVLLKATVFKGSQNDNL